MSKVRIDVDTTEKTMTVKVDNKPVDNVHNVSIFAEDSVFGFEIEIVSKEELGDMRKFTRIIASDTKEAQSLTKSGKAYKSKKFDGFVVTSAANPENQEKN